MGRGERRFFSESLNHKTDEVGRASWGPPGPPLKQGHPEQVPRATSRRLLKISKDFLSRELATRSCEQLRSFGAL